MASSSSDLMSGQPEDRHKYTFDPTMHRFQKRNSCVRRHCDNNDREGNSTELVCVLRYKHHHYVAEGLPAEAIKQEFLEHANEEQQHADLLADRIIQLGGNPNLDPADLSSRSHAEYGDGGNLAEILRDDLVAERIAIEAYTEAIRFLGDDDPTTKRLLEGILATEEKHAEEVASMLAHVSQAKTPRQRTAG